MTVLAAGVPDRVRVQVETNGTQPPDRALVDLVDLWVVSPKLANSGMDYGSRIVPAALTGLMATGRTAFKGDRVLDVCCGRGLPLPCSADTGLTCAAMSAWTSARTISRRQGPVKLDWTLLPASSSPSTFTSATSPCDGPKSARSTSRSTPRRWSTFPRERGIASLRHTAALAREDRLYLSMPNTRRAAAQAPAPRGPMPAKDALCVATRDLAHPL
jgi:hypothetical protein